MHLDQDDQHNRGRLRKAEGPKGLGVDELLRGARLSANPEKNLGVAKKALADLVLYEHRRAAASEARRRIVCGPGTSGRGELEGGDKSTNGDRQGKVRIVLVSLFQPPGLHAQTKVGGITIKQLPTGGYVHWPVRNPLPPFWLFRSSTVRAQLISLYGWRTP